MGEFLERVKLHKLVNGNSIEENYINNSTYYYYKYRESDEEVTSINLKDIQLGRFYFLHYHDPSNWMKYSPIFTVDVKRFGDIICLIAINMNFLPIEVRYAIFDKYITEDDLDKDRALRVDFPTVYKILREIGFEYSLIEYNLEQIKLVHKIKMSSVPRFVLSGHPVNKYDPKKLYEICLTKLKDQAKRDKEMTSLLVKDLFASTEEIEKNFDELKDHAKRIRKSFEKYRGLS